MYKAISHDRKEETLQAKARWFQSLTVKDRADLLCQYTDVILEVNPKIIGRKNAQPVAGRILIVSKT